MQKNSPEWKALDDLCREIVRVRDGRKCRVCGRPATDTVHIIDRDVAITRCDPTNLYAGCSRCHDHLHPMDLLERHIFVVGWTEYLRLRELSQQLVTYRKADLLEIADKLKAELRYLRQIERELKI